MGSGGVAIAALPTVICFKVTFSDGLGGGASRPSRCVPSRSIPQPWHDEADEPARRCLYVRKGEMGDAWKLKDNLIVRRIFGYLILF